MALSAQYLVDQTRLVSGLRNNRLFSDAAICQLLSDGIRDFRDKITVGNFAGWFRDTFDFSLTSTEDGCKLDLASVPNLEMVQGLDLLNNDAPPFTVPMLDSFASRNWFAGAWPLTIGPSFNGFVGRRYYLDGDFLIITPSTNAAGNYRLIYTPMTLPLALPTTPPPHVVSLDTGDVTASVGRWQFPAASFNDSDIGASFTVTGATAPGDNGTFVITAIGNSSTVYTAVTGLVDETFGVAVSASVQPTSASTRTIAADPADSFQGSDRFWTIADAAFTDSDVGAVLNVDLAEPNRFLNGQALISTVFSSTSVVVETTIATSQTSPVSGSFTIDRRQLNTVPELPQPLTPWSKYPILFAALAIRTSRQQQTTELELQFQQLGQRVTAVTKQRSEGVRQAPITRGYGGGWGWR